MAVVRLYRVEKRSGPICKLREAKVSNFGKHLLQGRLVSDVAEVVVAAVDNASLANNFLGHGMRLLCSYKGLEDRRILESHQDVIELKIFEFDSASR